MKLSSRLKIVLMIAVISTALIVLEKFKMPLNTFFWNSVFDFGHIPLFGVISIALLGLSQAVLKRHFSNPMMHYLLAFCLTGLLGLTTEIIQYFTPRDADLWDIVNDGIGAFCFLSFYLTLDRRVSNTKMALNHKLKYFIRLTVFLLGLGLLTPTVIWVSAYVNRDLSFPVICTFESPWEQKFIFTNNTRIKIVPSPFDQNRSEKNHVGQLILDKRGRASFIIDEPYPDWTGFENFSFIVYSKQSEVINLEFRINDRTHNYSDNDRFNRTLTIKPGINNIVIPLEEIKMAPDSRVMDMSNIKLMILFTGHSIDSLDIFLDDFRLE